VEKDDVLAKKKVTHVNLIKTVILTLLVCQTQHSLLGQLARILKPLGSCAHLILNV